MINLILKNLLRRKIRTALQALGISAHQINDVKAILALAEAEDAKNLNA